MTKTALDRKGKYNDKNDYAPGLSIMYSIMYSAVRRLAGIGLSIQQPPA